MKNYLTSKTMHENMKTQFQTFAKDTQFLCKSMAKVRSKYDFHKDYSYYKIALRGFFILNCFWKNKNLRSIEKGDLKHGNFKKALHYCIICIGAYGTNKDMKNFIDWINKECSDNGLSVISNKNILNIDNIINENNLTVESSIF